MPRPFKCRSINAKPVSVIYKPAGVPARQLEWVTLHLDEFETVRLLDHIGLEQEKAAIEMGVSRPTVTRIYASARKKIADAIVLGQAICIEGGPVVESGPFGSQRGGGPMGCGGGRRRHRGGRGEQ